MIPFSMFHGCNSAGKPRASGDDPAIQEIDAGREE